MITDIKDLETWTARWSQCVQHRCLVQPLNSLATIESAPDCLASSLQELRSPQFEDNPWNRCYGSVYLQRPCRLDADCKQISLDSFCNLTSIICTGLKFLYDYQVKSIVPCSDANPCYDGDCQDGFCHNFTTDRSLKFQRFTQCLLDKMDPYLAAILKRQLLNLPGDGTIFGPF
jgi:hypothetical protein